VTSPVRPTGLSLIDLMGVNRILVQQGADAQAFAAWAGSTWRQTRGLAGEWRFDRLQPLGLVTWTTPGATARVVSRTPGRIELDAHNNAGTPGTIVLARAWYPGWSARLNGAPVMARPLAGLLVSVAVPARSAGHLEVSFWPTGLTAGLVLAAIGCLLLTLGTLFPRLIDEPVARLGEVMQRRAARRDRAESRTAATPR